MKIEARIFEVLAAFFFMMGVIYTIVTYFYDQHESIEWAGAVALFFSGGLALIVGTYFRFVSRRVEIRPEDYDDAEIEDGAGELGFFSPHSYWPILVAASAAIFALGFATRNWWLCVPAAVGILVAAGGMVLEYYLGPEKH